MALRYVEKITRPMLRAERGVLFAFGDNLEHRGFGGQAAAMRGEINAVGIVTKTAPTMAETGFLSDRDLKRVAVPIDVAFDHLRMQLLRGGDVVWPAAGIGTGLAQLPQRAPLIWTLIEVGRIDLERIGPVVGTYHWP